MRRPTMLAGAGGIVLDASTEPDPTTDAAAPARPWPRKVYVGGAIVALYVVVALLAPVLAPQPPNQQVLLERLSPPSGAHLLGTDDVGRDNLSRLIYAARVDLPVAFLAVFFPFVIGVALGAVAGYRSGFVDQAASRVADVVQAFPVYVLILALIAVLGTGARSIVVASTIVSWVAYFRLARAEVMRIRGRDYIAAARIGGLGGRRVLLRHVMPNVIAQPVVYFMSDMVALVLTLSALSFLGLGIPAPTAEWGRMIADAQPYIASSGWLIIPPGLALVGLGVGFSLIADGLDDRFRR